MDAIASAQELIEARKTVLHQVSAVLVDALRLEAEPEDIDPDSPLFGTGLGLDSIDAVELVVAVEMAFEVRFPDSGDLRPLRTINTLADFILAGRAS